ncbi:esterase family protein [Niabella drilacis]|uniref:Esterase/lipase superfamily enzyme n=1 Tax=Niabella drilacis (strain DSM 25811 / CCM 8410 / CCUG 62505 / LMG 26954 / E90) TaxID=1285928 RepID=A0A1G6M5J8_NIADE|nr:alpha/beta hydrolase-fold protein [Niabella drilacis]SDC50637.1 Esterase/lipase superfamily enzyme [Niabella drilacis]
MNKHISSWFSPSLQKEMPIVSYGSYGTVLLLVPTAGADYLEYERFQLIDSLAPFIDAGKLKVYSIDSVNNESWLNKHMDHWDKAQRHEQWNTYVYNEVLPFIKNESGEETPVFVSGASFGALHSMNLFLKRPDLLGGVIAMSGVYDLTYYTDGFMNDTVYFNSPWHYMPNLADHGVLEQIRKSPHIHILTGAGAYEDPKAGGAFARILYDKGIYYEFDNWGESYKHDWPTWREMLPHYIGTRF